MACVDPLIAVRDRGTVRLTGRVRSGFFKTGEYVLPCGTCVGCLRRRAGFWAVRCSHEMEVSDRACFITLTYDEEHLPYAGSLVPEHLQKFMRRLRKKVAVPVRFLACGEYGEKWGRPHYHGILFGCDFVADRYVCGRRSGESVYRSPSLELLWPYGRSEIGSVTFNSAAYVAGYVGKKLGRSALAGREPEFLRASLKPGLGIPWLERNYAHVYARDSVVADAYEVSPPRAYDKWLQVRHPFLYEEVKFKREEGHLSPSLNGELSRDRLDVIEEVLYAQVNRFAREVEV